MKAFFRLLLAALWMCGGDLAAAQPGSVRGTVRDRSDGQPLESVTLTLEDGVNAARRTLTNVDGFFVFPQVSPGRYLLRATYVGFRTYADTLYVADGETVRLQIALVEENSQLDELVVEDERAAGAARNTAGQQTIRPEDVERVPTPDVTGDLASYLGTIPGVVTSGDRGGQLFVRGGEPSQNLVQMDGMMVYQPFHILGLYSSFPADILQRADVYSGGFGSRFGEAISSVIDVTSRPGNFRRLAGAVGVSPFITSALLEGPLVRDRASVLLNIRQSVLEEGAERVLNQRLPFRFGDYFGRLQADLTETSRLSVTGLRTYDRGTVRENTGSGPEEQVRWSNFALGARYLVMPRALDVLAAFHLSTSRHTSEIGAAGQAWRTAHVRNHYAALDATFFSEAVTTDFGMALRMTTIESSLGGEYQNVLDQRDHPISFAVWAEPEFELAGVSLRPGLRIASFHSRIAPMFEPRFRAVWRRGVHQVSGSAGVYRQEITGVSDRRDAASVFSAWSMIPRKVLRLEQGALVDVRQGRMPSAVHAILGYRISPAPSLDFSVEGFYKDLSDLFVAEWTPFPVFNRRLQPAQGRAAGFDVRAEGRKRGVYATANYGFSATRYRAKQETLRIWYGDPTLEYNPAHDRRHRINVLLGARVKGFDANARWDFGSGLPYTRVLGFDGFAVMDSVRRVTREPATRRTIYERPFLGVLPAYHRLDVSIERAFDTRYATLTVQASALNLYNRRNIFYLDTFTMERVDQLPFVPSLGVRVAFQ